MIPMRIAPLVFSLSAALAAGSASAAQLPAGEQFPLPGYWAMTTSVTSPGSDLRTPRSRSHLSNIVRL